MGRLIKNILYSLLVLLLSYASCNADNLEEHSNENDVDTISTADVSILDKLFDKLLSHGDSSTQDYTESSEVEIMVDESYKQGQFSDIASIRVIDKTLGKLYNLDIPIGSRKSVKEFSVKVYKCWSPEGKTILPEGKALIEIYEGIDKKNTRLFYGWIFAQSPSVSSIAHAKYDVTLRGCSAFIKTEQKEGE